MTLYQNDQCVHTCLLRRPQNHDCFIDPLNNWHIRCVPEPGAKRAGIDKNYQNLNKDCDNCPTWTHLDSDYKAYLIPEVNKLRYIVSFQMSMLFYQFLKHSKTFSLHIHTNARSILTTHM